MKTISPKELKAKLDSKEPLQLLDVRENDERALCNIGGLHIPLGDVANRIHELSKDSPLVVYCRSGGRSGRVVELLEQKGFTNVINLVGGILRWSDEVDSSIVKY